MKLIRDIMTWTGCTEAEAREVKRQLAVDLSEISTTRLKAAVKQTLADVRSGSAS